MKTIVVGGGASGMVSAYFSKMSGDDVVLIEKNEKLGKKLYITGKGRCNLTNNTDVDSFMLNVVSNPKFLLSSIYNFTPKDTIDFFESLNLPLKTERGNRVFPISDKSSDVIKALQNALTQIGVQINLNENVLSIREENGAVKGVKTDKGEYLCNKVIVATGGLSYSSTGSTGDGYKFAKMFGHTVSELKPSLCGLNLEGEEFKNLQGLSLKNVKLTAYLKGKEYYSEIGELLFTHYGISGPLTLTCSALTTRKDLSDITLSIDLKPGLTEKELDKRLLRDFEININKELKNSLNALLPKALIPTIISRTQIDENKKINLITQTERSKLVYALKNFNFKLKSLRDFNEAVITSGGISVKEINPKTMESKIIKGLHFVGEVLDVDAFTGGYNLQIAFSTGKSGGEREF